jgi:hypothetical protein
VVGIPIEECTPLASILGILSLTSEGLRFEGVVVTVGYYYYNHKTRAIEKRAPKRKRGKIEASQDVPERNIKWKVGPDAKDNALQVASVLSAFAGVNIVSVHEVTVALDDAKSRIAELEMTLEDHQRIYFQ